MQYAQVAVDSPAPLKTYSYLVPPSLSLSLGQAVWVPFGRSVTPLQGIVFGFSDEAPVRELKPVAAAIDDQPVLSAADCTLAEWLSDYYLAPLYECAALMMPPGFRQRVRVVVEATGGGRPAGGLPPVAARLLESIEGEGPVDLERVRRRFGRNADGMVERLVRAGLVRRVSRLPRAPVGPRYIRRLAVTDLGRAVTLTEPAWNRRPRQRDLLAYLVDAGGSASTAEAAAMGHGGPAASGLLERGLITVERERMVRDPLAGRTFQGAFPPVLTSHQEAAVRRIQAGLAGAGSGSFLLHGVTGSGKTEVYLRALEACVAVGRRAIVLVPEIALEPQTVAQFSARFPGRVAVLHSGVTAGEAYDEWWRVSGGEFDVVVGSRGAVFSPQPDLGLIVVDEEHEPTYKQHDNPPRYDARRVAEERARLKGAVLVLGSATPDLGTYVAARAGKHALVELPLRVGRPGGPPGTEARGLAGVEVVDLRQELKSGNRSIFSRALQEGLGATLKEGSQAVLFLNRRGTATFVQCRDCGAVVRCRNCETALTYHSAEERLLCHQCNLQRRVPSRCVECGSGRARYLGIGTQRVEAEAAALFPEARLLRWDRDTAQNRRSHEDLLGRFSRGEADILVGTQMIAKGLDVPRVTLVGIVNADVGLYLPDFRAAERTFQLLTQVAGRAGRGALRGRVIIQTYTPDHYAIRAAAAQDYAGFAAQELAFRERHRYPPAQPMVRLVYSHVVAEEAREEASRYGKTLAMQRARAGRTDVHVMAAVPAYFRRVRGRHRWQVLLKGPGARDLLVKSPPPRGWVIDVDPVHIL